MNRALALAVLSVVSLALAGGREAPLPAVMDHSAHAMPAHVDMQAMNAQMLATLRPLKGRAFDVAFAQQMIRHHQMALDMAREALQSGRDARVRAAAQDVLRTQQQEIALMNGWLRSWTGRPSTVTPMPMHVMGETDRWFLTEMIPHHQGAVDMAALVPARSQNAQVRALAARIAQAQLAEIKQYRQWLQQP